MLHIVKIPFLFLMILCVLIPAIAGSVESVAPQESKESASTKADSSARLNTILPQFSDYVEKAKAQWGAPGVAIGIVKDGKFFWVKGFGTRLAGQSKPVDENTIFQIASLSKNMLAHVMARLVQEKKISFDDPIIKYLPGFKINNDLKLSQTFTIRDALSHRSGLPGFSCDTIWYLNPTSQEMMDALAKIPLKNNPRGTYAYQNQIYGLASLVAEKVMNTDIESIYKRYFFDPLGMDRSSVSLKAIHPDLFSINGVVDLFKDHNVAYPHDKRGDQAHTLKFSKLNYLFAGSTGVNLSVKDYMKWMLMMLGQGTVEGQIILDQNLYQELITPHIDCHMGSDDFNFPAERYADVQYGMGHFMATYGTETKSVKVYSHMGAFYGTRALMMLVPSESMGIVVLSNLGSNRVSLLPEVLINQFMDMYLDLPDMDWSQRYKSKTERYRMIVKREKDMERLQNPGPHAPLTEYIGVYENDLYGQLTIRQNDGTLWIQFRGQDIPLTHFNHSQFWFPGYLLSPAFCETDIGYIYFGAQEGQKLLQIPLLFEGKEDGLFHKRADS